MTLKKLKVTKVPEVNYQMKKLNEREEDCIDKTRGEEVLFKGKLRLNSLNFLISYNLYAKNMEVIIK